jgi:hypothetical protein
MDTRFRLGATPTAVNGLELRRSRELKGRKGGTVATKITLSNGPAPATEKRVSEGANDVSMEINNALAANFKFVIFTDADTGKEFSVEPGRVQSIEAE